MLIISLGPQQARPAAPYFSSSSSVKDRAPGPDVDMQRMEEDARLQKMVGLFVPLEHEAKRWRQAICSATYFKANGMLCTGTISLLYFCAIRPFSLSCCLQSYLPTKVQNWSTSDRRNINLVYCGNLAVASQPMKIKVVSVIGCLSGDQSLHDR